MLRARSEDALQIEHGSLYPALHRLEREGWLASEWRRSQANRRARFYRLTAAGKRQLSREQTRWQRVVKTIARVMRPAEET
jgi:transcriptional regulator